jgi:hypothetical protein
VRFATVARLGVSLGISLSACAPRGPSVPAAPAPAPVVVASTAPTVQRAAEAVAAAEQAGAGRAARLAEGILFEGERIGAFVDVPAEECLLVLARGAASVADLDLVLWSDEGEWLAGDERRDADPSVILCPPHPSRVHATGLVAAGRGAVSLTAQRVPREREEGVRAWLVSLRPGFDRGDERARRTLVHANPDSPTIVPIDLEAGSCAEVRAAGSGSTADPDVVLLDARGVVRRKAPVDAGDAVRFGFCAREAFQGQLAVRSRLGQADVVVAVRTATRAQWESERRRVDELDAAGEPSAPVSVRFPADEPLAAHAGLVERGLEALAGLSSSSPVQILRGVMGVPVTVPAALVSGPGVRIAIVRAQRSRFVARIASVEGAIRFAPAGVGAVTAAVAPLAQDLLVDCVGLDEGEPFLVLVARP